MTNQTSDIAHVAVKQLPLNLGSQTTSSGRHACNCIGPQNGEPECPCQMKNVIERDGRWIQKEIDLGPSSRDYWAEFEKGFKGFFK